MMQAYKKGYTLNEMIITVLVIMVIAIYMISVMSNKIKDVEYVIALKKANATLSESLTKIKANNGGFINVGKGTGDSYNKALRDDFCKVLKCSKTDITSNIFGSVEYRWYKGRTMGWPGNLGTAPAAVLNNGYFMRFYSYADCIHANVNACGYIDIDINGKNDPNMMGKDLYSFWIAKQNGNYALVPFGVPQDGYFCQENDWGCTAVRLYKPENMP